MSICSYDVFPLWDDDKAANSIIYQPVIYLLCCGSSLWNNLVAVIFFFFFLFKLFPEFLAGLNQGGAPSWLGATFCWGAAFTPSAETSWWGRSRCPWRRCLWKKQRRRAVLLFQSWRSSQQSIWLSSTKPSVGLDHHVGLCLTEKNMNFNLVFELSSSVDLGFRSSDWLFFRESTSID